MYGAHTILLHCVLQCCRAMCHLATLCVYGAHTILLYIVCCSFVHNVTELGAVPPVEEKEDEADMYDVPDKKPTSPQPLLDKKEHSKVYTSGQTALTALTHLYLSPTTKNVLTRSC